MEMEKCKAPSFEDGKTINYPGFKRSWCKVAGTVWDDANQIEQLKQKVDEYTKKILAALICRQYGRRWIKSTDKSRKW